MGCGRDSSGVCRESMGWVGQSGSWDGGAGGPSGGAGGGSNAGMDADRVSEGAGGSAAAGSVLRPARRSLIRWKIDGRPGADPPGGDAAGDPGRPGPGPVGAEAPPAAGVAEVGVGPDAERPASAPVEGVGWKASGRDARPGPAGSVVERGGVGAAAAGPAPAGSAAGIPLAASGWPPGGTSGASASVSRGAERRGSAPHWRWNRDRAAGSGVGRSSAGADRPFPGKAESLAEVEPVGALGSLAAGAVGPPGWPLPGPGLAPGMAVGPVPCSLPVASGGMAVAGP